MVEGASTERLALGIYETTPHGTVCYDYTVHALWTTITGRRCPRVVRGYRRTPPRKKCAPERLWASLTFTCPYREILEYHGLVNPTDGTLMVSEVDYSRSSDGTSSVSACTLS